MAQDLRKHRDPLCCVFLPLDRQPLAAHFVEDGFVPRCVQFYTGELDLRLLLSCLFGQHGGCCCGLLHRLETIYRLVYVLQLLRGQEGLQLVKLEGPRRK